jgi:hypothetical protein
MCGDALPVVDRLLAGPVRERDADAFGVARALDPQVAGCFAASVAMASAMRP